MNTRWPFWRKIMLAGALWILVVVIVFNDRPTSVLAAFAFAIGYGCLMVGFWSAMRDKRAGGLFSRGEDDDAERRGDERERDEDRA